MAHIDSKDREILPDPEPAPRQRYFQPSDLLVLIATVDRYASQAKQFNGKIAKDLEQARTYLVEAAREHCYLEKLAETTGQSIPALGRNRD